MLVILDLFTIFLTAIFINFIFSDSYLENYKIFGQRSILTLIFLGFFTYRITSNYISITRYIRAIEIYKIAFINLILISLFLSLRTILDLNIASLRIYLLFWFVNTSLIVMTRFTIKEIFIYKSYLKAKKLKKVVIYGAGSAGAQLASSLILNGSHNIAGFIDDSPNLCGRRLSGIRIYSSSELGKLKNQIDQILFAIPSLTRSKTIKILDGLKDYGIPVLKVPSIEALTNGTAKINSLIPIEIEDLLGRGQVDPDSNLLELCTKDHNICVTGAGGSIGSEICRQILNLNPKTLLLIDINEYSLYSLEKEIGSFFSSRKDIKIYYKLGNACNYKFIKKAFIKYKIDIVYHAAAYKHVPLLEINPLQGIENNIISTDTICRAASQLNLSKVIFISTDKAVRPANVMGASKRLAEQILQNYAKNTNAKKSPSISGDKYNTKFSIVRFGNVLGSSGSVVPLFKKQISNGGPITLTDKNVIRYFMTISEAAQLVIQSSSLAEGGDIFLLDMGNPVRIYDLAKQMIRLSGLQVKDKDNMDGDIEIITTGLRPGEKLYEELLIDGNPERTKHPLIFKANEKCLSQKDLEKCMSFLNEAIINSDEEAALKILSEFVTDWKRI